MTNSISVLVISQTYSQLKYISIIFIVVYITSEMFQKCSDDIMKIALYVDVQIVYY